jgi:hypothetical protein
MTCSLRDGTGWGGHSCAQGVSWGRNEGEDALVSPVVKVSELGYCRSVAPRDAGRLLSCEDPWRAWERLCVLVDIGTGPGARRLSQVVLREVAAILDAELQRSRSRPLLGRASDDLSEHLSMLEALGLTPACDAMAELVACELGREALELLHGLRFVGATSGAIAERDQMLAIWLKASDAGLEERVLLLCRLRALLRRLGEDGRLPSQW